MHDGIEILCDDAIELLLSALRSFLLRATAISLRLVVAESLLA
jgi:hypothetical protein